LLFTENLFALAQRHSLLLLLLEQLSLLAGRLAATCGALGRKWPGRVEQPFAGGPKLFVLELNFELVLVARPKDARSTVRLAAGQLQVHLELVCVLLLLVETGTQAELVRVQIAA